MLKEGWNDGHAEKRIPSKTLFCGGYKQPRPNNPRAENRQFTSHAQNDVTSNVDILNSWVWET